MEVRNEMRRWEDGSRGDKTILGVHSGEENEPKWQREKDGELKNENQCQRLGGVGLIKKHTTHFISAQYNDLLFC